MLFPKKVAYDYGLSVCLSTISDVHVCGRDESLHLRQFTRRNPILNKLGQSEAMGIRETYVLSYASFLILGLSLMPGVRNRVTALMIVLES